jgi:PKHD-type hydroxylase
MRKISLNYEFHNQYETFQYFPKVFTPEECQKIIEIGTTSQVEESRVGALDSEDGAVEPRVRKSFNSWITLHNRPRLLNKIEAITNYANSFYQFELNNFDEQIQFTQYNVGNYYHWHQDSGSGFSMRRKLSLVVNLSHEMSYEGGSLQFFGNRHRTVGNEQGSVIAFPAYEYHRVTPVKKGVRNSLVIWVQGHPFR